jgi:hypothetical protein
MPFGLCKMCLQEKNLVSSHLIPRKVYEYCDREGTIRLRFRTMF